MWEVDHLKKAEHWRINAFQLWCWLRLLRVPWTERKANQSVLKRSVLNNHWKDWCWSWNLNTLATWCKLTHLKRPWCCKRLKAGGEGVDRAWDVWMASLTWWTWVWASSGCWWWTRKPGVLQFYVVTKSHTWLYDWTEQWSQLFIINDLPIALCISCHINFACILRHIWFISGHCSGRK